MNLLKYHNFINEAGRPKKKSKDYVYSKEFSEEELNVAIDRINNILTIFKDEGIKCDVDPTRFLSGGRCLGIYISFGIKTEIYSERDDDIVWNDDVKKKFKSMVSMINFMGDEIDNLITNLEEFFVIDNLNFNDNIFSIVVSNK